MNSLFQFSKKVEFSETDMAGIVHFSNYFKWMGACEERFFENLNIPLFFNENQVFHGWPRVNTSCQFNAPIRFGEMIHIDLFIEELKEKWIRYRFEFNKSNQTNNKPAATGHMTTVFANMNPSTGEIKACLMKDELYQKLNALISNLK